MLVTLIFIWTLLVTFEASGVYGERACIELSNSAAIVRYSASEAPILAQIRILLADDHTIIRSGIKLLLEQQPDFKVVAEAGDGREAVELVSKHHPDVAVLDIGMPELNGIEATRQIASTEPPSQVVILSMHADEGYVLRALKAGARGYILKNSAEADLIRAIRSVAEGKSFFSPVISKMLLDDYVRQLRDRQVEDSYDLLTPREREVLQLLAEGKTNKEVANILHLSVYTVDTHRGNILQKLNLHGVPELILYAVRKGIIS
jgi:DNA-binding NarL/FixJ family response regulator